MPRLIRGFTLIELMIVVSILGILLLFGVPSFRDFVRSNRLTTQANEFITSVKLARAEAVRRNRNIVLTPSDASDNSNEWGPGWAMTDPTEANALRVIAALPGTLTLDGPDTLAALTFNSTGMLDGITLDQVFLMCNDQKAGHRITLTRTGQTSQQETVCP